MSSTESPGQQSEFSASEVEVSFADVALRLWRRRVIVIAGPLLAFLLALIWASSNAAGAISAPIVLYIELKGVVDGTRVPQYPNGAAFSPQDLLLPEVLQAVVQEHELAFGPNALRGALNVGFGSPLAAGVIEKYRGRLANSDLDPAQIDVINEEFADELRGTTRRGLRIAFDFRAVGLNQAGGEQLVRALPAIWSRIFVNRFRIFLPIALPSSGRSGGSSSDLSETSEILLAEAGIRNMSEGLDLMMQDNRLVSLVTDDGNSARDLRRELRDYETIRFAPVYGQVFAEPDLLARAHVRDLELQIRELDLQIEGVNATIEDLQRFRTTPADISSTSSAPSELVPLSDSWLREIVNMANQGALADYLAAALDTRRALFDIRAKLVTRLGRMRPIDGREATSTEDSRTAASEGLNWLVGEYRELVALAYEKLRNDQGQLYDPVGEPERARPPGWPSGTAYLLIGALAGGLLLSATIALVVPPGMLSLRRFVE